MESKLLDAERALAAVNQAVGSVREQLTKAATDLIAVEREIDKVNATGQELRDLQIRIDAWLDEAKSIAVAPVHKFDLDRGVNAFADFLRVYLKASVTVSSSRSQPPTFVSTNATFLISVRAACAR